MRCRDFSQQFETHISGFGPIAAAAVCSRLLGEFRPQRLILIGIAGSYDDRLEIGSATSFDRVACWGIGAGTETDLQLPSQMGFPQLSPCQMDSEQASQPGIYEQVGIEPATEEYADRLLITVTAAAATQRQVDTRLNRFPTAVAEDMEGFGVALAARLCSVPLTIIRGISNRAGVRDQREWNTDGALAAAAALAVEAFGK